jgi:hypothetical protein
VPFSIKNARGRSLCLEAMAYPSLQIRSQYRQDSVPADNTAKADLHVDERALWALV